MLFTVSRTPRVKNPDTNNFWSSDCNIFLCVFVTHWCRGPRGSGSAGNLWRSGCRWCQWRHPCRGTGLWSGCTSCPQHPQGGSHRLGWGSGTAGVEGGTEEKSILNISTSSLAQSRHPILFVIVLNLAALARWHRYAVPSLPEPSASVEPMPTATSSARVTLFL